MATATDTPFTIDPGMHPRIAQRIVHNLDVEAPLQTVTRVAAAALQAHELVEFLSGSVILNLADENGPLAEVVLYSGDRTACVRDARTGWRFTVTECEDDELGDTYLLVVNSERGEG